jgi:hypothetical protein
MELSHCIDPLNNLILYISLPLVDDMLALVLALELWLALVLVLPLVPQLV